jgi:hypothetical protein
MIIENERGWSLSSLLQETIKLLLMAAVLIMVPLANAKAQGTTYNGPQQLSLSQTNPTGACACGSTVSGNAAATAIAFAPILSVVIKEVITLANGEEEIIYETMVAVVEMERVGADYYVKFFEMREEDVNGFISSRNQAGNIYYVMGAEEFLENNASDANPADEILPPGVNIQELQVFELPPEDEYQYMFFEGPGGERMDYEEFIAMASGAK